MRYRMSKKQIISEANKIRSELRYGKMDGTQKKFIRTFVRKNKGLIWVMIWLVIGETLLSLALPFISYFYLEKSFALMNYRIFMIVGIALIVLIILFLIASYLRIYVNQKFSLYFINEIREAWYGYFLKHSVAFNKKFDGKKLLTKMLYHVQLLRMGLNNVLYQSVQATFLYIGIVVFAFLFNPRLFVVLWIALPVLLIVFIIMDYIGRYYVTREQTFNSRIVSHLADSLINFDVLKTQAREEEMMKKFNDYIELDTFFRIRRQLWVQYSNRLLYGLMLLFGVGLYFVQLYWPFIEFDSISNVASTGFILGFFSKVLFSYSRMGIFMEAFRLGLRLSVPTFPYLAGKTPSKSKSWKNIKFSGKKTKLSKYGGYIKNFLLNIKKDERILIYSGESSGKTTLAKVITGQKAINSLNVTFNKKRVNSGRWCQYKSENYFISANPMFDITIGEYLLGESSEAITNYDIDAVFKALKPHKFFDFLFANTELLGRRISPRNLSMTETVLIQIAYCLLRPKSIIAVDHSCIDMGKEPINQALKLLEKSSKSTAIIIFSSKVNTLISYEKTFHLDKAGFTQV